MVATQIEPCTTAHRRVAEFSHSSLGAAGAALAGCLGEENDDPDDVANDDTDDVTDDDDTDEWENVDEFYFEGRVQAWTGIEPAIIEGEDNPTIVLFEGEEYDFRWVNEDGTLHNIEIRDEDGNVVDGYETEGVSGQGEEEMLEGVVATAEMATYVCRFHQTTQVGDIDVRSG